MSKQRVADAIAGALVRFGITDLFMITGGGSLHLNDAFGRQTGLKKIFCHHEQASTIAAESYGRLLGRPAAVNVTTGPGGVNALNGVYGAYVDSIPMVVISGQVKRETLARNHPIALRQLGDQEVDIVKMAKQVTKYSVVLQDPSVARQVVERALALSIRGRPGPVWIDVPVDVQGALIEWDALAPYDPAGDTEVEGVAPNSLLELGALQGLALEEQARAVLEELAKAQRPVVFAGNGVRLSGAHELFVKTVERLGIPVVTGFNAHDAIHNGSPVYVGRPGTVGDRTGNFAVQNADYVLVLGCRLNIRQVSYNWKSFARNARVAMVDIDRAELEKPTLALHRPVHAHLRDFLGALQLALARWEVPAAHRDYLAWCRDRARRYPVVLKSYWDKPSPVNPYCFLESLFEQLQEGEIVVAGDGTACVSTFQAAALKKGQRLYTNSGCASMGYDLPAAIGAFHASKARRIVCIAGDGSIMMNLQELQTIAGERLPIKLFVLNNEGYHSIRQSQQNHFPDNLVGCGPDSGITFPDFVRLSAGFGIPAARVGDHRGLRAAVAAALDSQGPYLCEVLLDKEQQFAPKLVSRRLEDGSMASPALEDMHPFLSRDELASNMPWSR